MGRNSRYLLPGALILAVVFGVLLPPIISYRKYERAFWTIQILRSLVSRDHRSSHGHLFDLGSLCAMLSTGLVSFFFLSGCHAFSGWLLCTGTGGSPSDLSRTKDPIFLASTDLTGILISFNLYFPASVSAAVQGWPSKSAGACGYKSDVIPKTTAAPLQRV